MSLLKGLLSLSRINNFGLLKLFSSKSSQTLEMKNELIVKRYEFVRLIDHESGILQGPIRSEEALSNRPDDFDLVILDGRHDPPVVRFRSKTEDFKNNQRREEAATRARLANKLKEMHMTTVTEDHDFVVKINRVEEWITKGWRVKIVVEEKRKKKILGKGLIQPQVDAKKEMMTQIMSKLAGTAEISGTPEMERGCLTFTLNPTQKILSKIKQERKN